MSSRAAGLPPPDSHRARRGGSVDHFRLVAEHAPVMLWLAAPDRQCIYVNRSWLAFTGRAIESELGAGWTEGIHPEDRDAFLATYARAFDAMAPFEAEIRLRRSDGQYRLLVDRGVPLLEEDQRAGFVGSCVDVTDRRLAQQALALVSHELRTPLNGIKSWAHVLENQLRDADPATQRALDGIRIGVEHQVRLLDELLE